AVTGELTDERVRDWQRAVGAWFLGETDLRGWDDQLGWLHAIAHGADTPAVPARPRRPGRLARTLARPSTPAHQDRRRSGPRTLSRR
ncbi:MAG TPA: DUF2785 domain-containing protein, partial [Micromonosporaceae bacterium]|nr:DUF2785 domain-containing protein [Micromonosporaceae bacterium]